MQQLVDDIRIIGEKAKAMSSQHQQNVNEMQSVKRQLNTVKDTCSEVQETMAGMENKKTSFEKLITILDENLLSAIFTKKNEVVTDQQNIKVQQPRPHKITKQNVISTNAKSSILKSRREII